jgi:hypothetical protein
MQLAKEYQGRAAELAGGQLPDIGDEAAPVVPDFTQPIVQQQQQPQDPEEGEDPKPKGFSPVR